MKHFIWIGILIIIFFAGDRLGGAVLKRITEKSQFRYSRLYNSGAQADILLIGNSRGLTFYQPEIERVTGKSTFNLSYNAMPMDLAKVLISDYYMRYPAPKLLLIDVTMCDRTNPELIAGFNCFTEFSDSLYDLIKRKDKNSAYAGALSHLYRYNSEVFQRVLYYRNRSDEDWLLDRVITQGLVDAGSTMEVDSLREIPEIMTALKETVVLAQQNGTTVKLLVNPYYPPFAQKIPDFDYFKKTVEGITGLPVTDYSQVIKETEYYGDYKHLNKAGSFLFIDRLLKDGIFNTERFNKER